MMPLRRVHVLMATVLCAGALAAAQPAVAAAGADPRQPAGERQPGRQPPRGTVGAASAQGWDAVTIPGWQVASGPADGGQLRHPRLPGAPGAQSWPAARGRLFARRRRGHGRLTQQVPLRTWPGRGAPRRHQVPRSRPGSAGP